MSTQPPHRRSRAGRRRPVRRPAPAIEASLPAGTYAVRVQSWSGDDGGSYTLAAD